MIIRRLGVVLLVAALVASGALSTAAAQIAGTSPAADLEAEIATTTTVELDGKRLFQVRGISAYPAERRAERIKDRIEALARNPDFRVEALRRVESDLGVKIAAGDQLVMMIFDVDARSEGVNPRELANANIDRIRQAIADYRQARSPSALLEGVIFAAAGAAGLAAMIAFLL